MFSKYCIGDTVMFRGKEVKVIAIQGYSTLHYTRIAYLVDNYTDWVKEEDLQEVV